MSDREFTIHISGVIPLAPRFFYDDSPVNEHEDATELGCSREVARYVAKHGLTAWLRDWNLDDLTVYIGDYPAVLNGKPLT